MKYQIKRQGYETRFDDDDVILANYFPEYVVQKDDDEGREEGQVIQAKLCIEMKHNGRELFFHGQQAEVLWEAMNKGSYYIG